MEKKRERKKTAWNSLKVGRHVHYASFRCISGSTEYLVVWLLVCDL